jgi:hypothetical protein
MDVTIGHNNEGKEIHNVISTDAQVFVFFCVVLTCIDRGSRELRVASLAESGRDGF